MNTIFYPNGGKFPFTPLSNIQANDFPESKKADLVSLLTFIPDARVVFYDINDAFYAMVYLSEMYGVPVVVREEDDTFLDGIFREDVELMTEKERKKLALRFYEGDEPTFFEKTQVQKRRRRRHKRSKTDPSLQDDVDGCGEQSRKTKEASSVYVEPWIAPVTLWNQDTHVAEALEALDTALKYRYRIQSNRITKDAILVQIYWVYMNHALKEHLS